MLGALIALVISAACDSGVSCAKQAFETKDTKRALELYERACSLKFTPACAQAALLTRDAERAKKLCDAQDALGCGVEGVLEPDDAKALRHFMNACQMGLLTACGANINYEYEGPEQALRFTKVRADIPRHVRWRVFKMDLPDRKAIRFQP
ncbi:MAG: hypothetical protein QM817_03980 [Archangium sp.]